MSVTVEPTQDQVYVALFPFLTGLLPAGTQVIRGLPNRAAMPPPTGFVVMQALFQERLRMPIDTYVTGGTSPPTTSTIEQGMDLAVQIDCYGPNSGTWAALIATAFEDDYGFTALGPNCEPLYANQARMTPFVNAEQQYEERWSVDCHLQWNPVATIQQQYADALDITLKDVNVLFPT